MWVSNLSCDMLTYWLVVNFPSTVLMNRMVLKLE